MDIFAGRIGSQRDKCVNRSVVAVRRRLKLAAVTKLRRWWVDYGQVNKADDNLSGSQSRPSDVASRLNSTVTRLLRKVTGQMH